jgi:hypothetical protein
MLQLRSFTKSPQPEVETIFYSDAIKILKCKNLILSMILGLNGNVMLDKFVLSKRGGALSG